MAPRRLREGAAVRQERREARLAARRVIAIDDAAHRVEHDVLRERREPHREASRGDVEAAARLLVDELEDGAVRDVQREAERAPARSTGDGLAEDRDVRVVAAEEPPIERLL